MKNIKCLGCLLLFSFLFVVKVSAQNWVGYNTSNFTGVSAVDYQPADIAGTAYKWDVLVTGIKGSAFNKNLLFGAGLDNLRKNTILGLIEGKDQRFIVTGVLYMPSVMYSVSKRSSIAFSTTFNAFGFGSTRTPAIFSVLSGKEAANGAYEGESTVSYVNTWSSLNLTYGYVLINKDQHRVKVGGTLRLSQGAGSAYFSLGNLSYDASNNQISNLSGNVKMQFNQQLEDLSDGEQVPLFSKSILGGDIGVVYEYASSASKEYETPYLLKFSSSLRNVGKLITYETASSSYNYDVTSGSLSSSSFEGITSISQLKDSLGQIATIQTPNSPSYKTKIPTSFMLMVDYQFKKNIFVNASYNYTYMKFGDDANQTYDMHAFNITSRYDKRDWGVIVPFTFSQYGSSVGFAARWKYVTIGSANLFNMIFANHDETFGANGYLVIRIPILYSKHKKQQKEAAVVSE